MSMKKVTPTRATSGRTPTLLWVLLIIVALALLIVIPFATWLFQQDLPPFNITIAGTDYVRSIHLGGLSVGHKLVLVATVFAAVVAVLIAVPVLVLTVLATVLIAVVLGVGLPLLMVAAMLVVALSPVLLLLALLRWMWRSSTPRAAVSNGLPVG